MRRIAGEQHSAPAVGIDKPRIVRPSAGVFERFDTDVGAADTAQYGFHLLARDWSRPVVRRTAELGHDQSAGKESIAEHATRCATKADGQQAFGMVDLSVSLIHRQGRIRAREVEAGHLADEAASPVAAYDVGAADMA
jgi:hypothetical protein